MNQSVIKTTDELIEILTKFLRQNGAPPNGKYTKFAPNFKSFLKSQVDLMSANIELQEDFKRLHLDTSENVVNYLECMTLIELT